MTGRWTPLNRGGRRPIDLPAAETSHRIITLPSSKLHSAQCSTQIQSNCLHPSCTLQCTTHCVVHSTHCTVYYTNTSKNTITDLHQSTAQQFHITVPCTNGQGCSITGPGGLSLQWVLSSAGHSMFFFSSVDQLITNVPSCFPGESTVLITLT